MAGGGEVTRTSWLECIQSNINDEQLEEILEACNET